MESKYDLSLDGKLQAEDFLQAAIKRTQAFAPYADLLWLETKSPNLEQAKYFSGKIREKCPEK